MSDRKAACEGREARYNTSAGSERRSRAAHRTGCTADRDADPYRYKQKRSDSVIAIGPPKRFGPLPALLGRPPPHHLTVTLNVRDTSCHLGLWVAEVAKSASTA